MTNKCFIISFNYYENEEIKDRLTEHKTSGQMDRTQIQNIRNKVEELNTDITIIMM